MTSPPPPGGAATGPGHDPGPAPGRPERSTGATVALGVRVIVVQVITLVVLWLLQQTFGA